MRIVIFIAVIFSLVSCTKQTIVGRWKCDTTGTASSRGQQGAITEFYNTVGQYPFEIEFKTDGTAISYTKKLDGTTKNLYYQYIKNHNGDPNKVLIRNSSDNSDETLMIIKKLGQEKLEASFEIVKDEFVMDLKMDKVGS